MFEYQTQHLKMQLYFILLLPFTYPSFHLLRHSSSYSFCHFIFPLIHPSIHPSTHTYTNPSSSVYPIQPSVHYLSSHKVSSPIHASLHLSIHSAIIYIYPSMHKFFQHANRPPSIIYPSMYSFIHPSIQEAVTELLPCAQCGQGSELL